MDFLRGYKTTLGALGTVLGGLAILLRGVSDGDVSLWQAVQDSLPVIGMGLAAFGIGKKIERNDQTRTK